MRKYSRFMCVLGTIVWVGMTNAWIDTVNAQEAEKSEAGKATTVGNPDIDIGRLRILLQPLTVDELKIEADAWQDDLEEKSKALSAADIAVRVQNEKIQNAEELAAAVEDVKNVSEDGVVKTPEQEAAAKEAQKRAEELQKAQEEPTAKPSEEEAANAVSKAVDKASKKAAEDDAKEDTKDDTSETRKKVLQEGVPEASDVPKVKVGEMDKAALEDAAATAKAKAVAEEEVKLIVLEDVVRLREERNGLIRRLQAVLDELKLKGGETESYDLYIASVARNNFDVSDWTALWEQLTGWILSGEGGLRWALNGSLFVGIIVAFFLLSRVAGKATERAVRVSSRMPELLRVFVVKTSQRLVMIIGIVMALSALEINIGPLVAALGAAGFVIAFALQNTLANFASGMMILIYRPFEIGDVVDVAGVSGKVNALNLVSTTIMTFDNKSVIVPNNSIWGDVITNATRSAQRRVDLVFGIGYGDDIVKAQGVLEGLVEAHPRILKDPAPTIRVNELGDNSVNFVCRPWVKTADYWDVYWDLMTQVKQKFDEEGISIPYPQRDVYVHTVTEKSTEKSDVEAKRETVSARSGSVNEEIDADLDDN